MTNYKTFESMSRDELESFCRRIVCDAERKADKIKKAYYAGKCAYKVDPKCNKCDGYGWAGGWFVDDPYPCPACSENPK